MPTEAGQPLKDGDLLAAKVLHERRPIDDRRRLAVHALVVQVAHHSYDFTPGASVALTNPLAERGPGLAPQLARQVLGDDGHWSALLEIDPREVTPCHQSRADGVEEAIALMREHAIRYLPVVEHGQPVGIVSLDDLSGEGDSRATLSDVEATPQKR